MALKGVIKYRVRPEDERIIAAAAARNGLSVNEYARSRAVREARQEELAWRTMERRGQTERARR